jgi:predicted Zn-dependent protease
MTLAQHELEAAIEASPSWDLARIELAEMLVAEGSDLVRAQAAMQGVRATENPRAELVRAQLAELTGDDAGAAEAYARALALRPDSDLRLRRGSALLRLGRDADAEAELLRFRAERPAETGVLVALAELRERGGRLAEAEADLRAAAEASPDRAAGWERLARFYARTGQPTREREAEARARGLEKQPERKLRPLLPSSR